MLNTNKSNKKLNKSEEKLRINTINTGERKTSFTVIRSDIESYLDTYIQFLCSFVSDSYKLTDKERQFLVLTILYQYNGGNLLDFSSFSEYMVSKRCCSKAEHVSIYKQKLSVKKWVKTKKYKFELQKGLNFKKGEDIFATFHLKLTE